MFTPPAALVTISVLTPIFCITRTGRVTSFMLYPS